jgi:hypothetical protein
VVVQALLVTRHIQGQNVNKGTLSGLSRLRARPLGRAALTAERPLVTIKEAPVAASAQLLLSALSKRPAELPADPDPHFCVFSAEGSCAETPLTSEPPLPDAAPLTSEPPLADAAPLTSEPTSMGAAAGLDPSGV